MRYRPVFFVIGIKILVALLVGSGVAQWAGAAELSKLALVDRPFQGDHAALSPDGRTLAYTRLEDEKFWLTLIELDQKVQRSVYLAPARREDGRYSGLQEMRWVTGTRLVMVSDDREIMAIDADGRNPARLWRSSDDGLINDDIFRRERFLVTPASPRLLPPLPDRPGQIMLESGARIGAETLANTFLIDAVTGAAELANAGQFVGNQIALYGRGDLLIWADLPRDVARWVDDPAFNGTGQVGLRELDRYFARSQGAGVMTASQVRAKLEMLMSFPPELVETEIQLNGWPPSPNPQGPPPPSPRALSAEDGGTVLPDSSSSGRMLYDRLGRPRLLYTEDTTGAPRQFLYFPPGKRAFEPNLTPGTLDTVVARGEKEFLLSPENYFGERSVPLAFDFDPNVLYYASNKGRDTWGVYALDLTSKSRTELTPAVQGVDFVSGNPLETDGVLVFDEARRTLAGIRFTTLRPQTAWLDPELRELQGILSAAMPKHAVEILNWDNLRQRFLVRASSEDDPGAVFVYRRAENSLEKVFSRSPWLSDLALHPTGAFSFPTEAGLRLTGYLTLPNGPKVTPPPLIVYLQGGLWDRAKAGFSREAELLADLGVAVLRLNYRGSAGFGRKHLLAIQEGLDSVPAADLQAAVSWLASQGRVDSKRVGLMGEGFGGYIALRALQLHPGTFRCGIILNAPTNLDAWAGWRPVQNVKAMYLDGGEESTATTDFMSLVRGAFVKQAKRDGGAAAEAEPGFRRPLLAIDSSNSSEGTPWSTALSSIGIGPRGVDVQHLSIQGPFENGRRETRERTFKAIEEFLNVNLYSFDVDLGPLREVKPGEAEPKSRP